MDQTSKDGDRVPDDGSIARVVGGRLTSVQFVLDHLILGFDEKGALTTLVWPEIRDSLGVVEFGADDYRNRLCALIPHKVADAVIDPDATIQICLDNGARLHIPLATYAGTGERAILTGPKHYLKVW